MDHFAGLDVSVKETSICIVDDAGKIVREVKVASEPEARGFVRRLIPMRGPAYLAIMTARPHPGPILRRDRHLEDAADHDAILQHVVIVVAPPAGQARVVRSLEDQRPQFCLLPT